MKINHGQALRQQMGRQPIVSFIGVYDTFSASIAAKHFDGLFISGFGFAASYYGLPDIGFIAWSDLVSFVQRVRTILPQHHIMVDIDDGYGDAEVAGHVVTMLAQIGASGVIIEDQKRPRRCGHLHGKQLLELDAYLDKLQRVLNVKQDMVVVARTDATDPQERMRRASAFDKAGADAILIDGIEDLDMLDTLSGQLNKPLMFNQIAGGKSPRCTLSELSQRGVGLVNYSTPCLFAAQEAIEKAMHQLKRDDGILPDPSSNGHINIARCNAQLTDNLRQRDNLSQTPIAN